MNGSSVGVNLNFCHFDNAHHTLPTILRNTNEVRESHIIALTWSVYGEDKAHFLNLDYNYRHSVTQITSKAPGLIR